MSSTFGSFEIGRRAIHVMQKGAEVTGQNIANANTEGYSRQLMNLQALVPPAVAGVETPPGYGVDVSAINRIKSEFYNDQIRQSLTAESYWSQLGETLTTIEVIFLEPGETGINTYLGEFFDAWQEVSVNPENYATRVSLVEQAETLTGVIQEMYNGMEDLNRNLEKEIDNSISEINVLAEEIADLNKKIVFLRTTGKNSNELLDERDLRLQELSEIIDITVWEKSNGAVEVLAGERILLHDEVYFPLEKVVSLNEATQEMEISIQNSLGFQLNLQGGELQGVMESFNSVLPFYRAALDDLVYNLVQEVNTIHREGYGLDGSTGLNFFETWVEPLPGDIIIGTDSLDSEDLVLGADPQTNITGISFSSGTKDSQKLLNGDYSIETELNYTEDSSAGIISSYGTNNQVLAGGVDVADDNDLNSSILFEVTKLDGDQIYLQYSYSHTKVNDEGELETVAGEGVKILSAGELNEDISFGSDADWTLELDLELEDVLNFSVGDKFIVQVAAAGGTGSDHIKLAGTAEGATETVYAITAQTGAFEGEQKWEFFQLDESTGEHRKVTLFVEVNGLITEPAAASFAVGPFAPENSREYIFQAAAKFKVNPYLLENKEAVAAAKTTDTPGDGTGALEIARLREKLVEEVGNTTFEDFFRGLMADLGVQGREAERLEANMHAIYENMVEQAESVAGVSLDDEMLNLVQYQQAYNAAAQFLSIFDEMLETLINEIR